MRYLPNTYPDYPAGGPPATLPAEQLIHRAQALMQGALEWSTKGVMPMSSGKTSKDRSIYTGVSGLALTYFRVALHPAFAGEKEAWLKRSYSTIESFLDTHTPQISFLCGQPGGLALAGAVAAHMGDKALADKFWNLLQTKFAEAGPGVEDELLFGKAGFIYSVLFLSQHLPGTDTDSVLKPVVDSIVNSGLQSGSKEFLVWRCFGSVYLGAAHGHVGIMYMLLHCWHLLDPTQREATIATLDRLLQMCDSDGNLQIIADCDAEQVHWCHGAPGCTAMYLKAHEVTNNPKYLQAALTTGEVVWKRGLLRKGLGLCHGITGNAYTFLSLYRFTNDPKHLHRASAFAMATEDKKVLEAIAATPDPQRARPGVPDSYESLMEGNAGVVCFLLDLAAPHGSRFPAWEL